MYPQSVVSINDGYTLESLYNKNELKTTGRVYHRTLYGKTLTEYIYNEKRFVRVLADSMFYNFAKFRLSNTHMYQNGDVVWINVEPVSWLYDEERCQLLSEKNLINQYSF